MGGEIWRRGTDVSLFPIVEKVMQRESVCVYACTRECVCVCVCLRIREREGERER
jgi:hypothetical protein